MRGIEQIPWLYDGLTALADPLGLARWRRRLVAGVRGRVEALPFPDHTFDTVVSSLA